MRKERNKRIKYEEELIKLELIKFIEQYKRNPTIKEINDNYNLPKSSWFDKYGGIKKYCNMIMGIEECNLTKEEKIEISIKALISLSKKLNKCPSRQEYEINRNKGFSASGFTKALNMNYGDICKKYLDKKYFKDTKNICNICNKEKPEKEFHKHGRQKSSHCKVCNYFKRHNDLIIREGWTKEEYYIVLDNVLNEKIECINELENILLDKTLDDIVYMIRSLGLKTIKLQIKFICDNCEKVYYRSLYRYDNSIYHLCGRDCNNEWFSTVISKTEEFKDKMRINTAKMLSEGKFDHVETNIQIMINNILKDMNIEYENEYNCKYVSIDNAIFVNNNLLFIECNGSFWHTDPRVYSTINYELQKKRIKMDKIKHTYIKNKYNIGILYLWEVDVLNNIDLCKKLILEYINNNGSLEDYHSFNYKIKENNLILNKDNLIIPYMDYDVDKLNEIIDLSVKERKEFYTTFYCENCEKEASQLTSQFMKNKHHYCSDNCKHHKKEVKFNTICNCCGEEIYVYPSKLKKNKMNFCNNECYKKFIKNKQ